MPIDVRATLDECQDAVATGDETRVYAWAQGFAARLQATTEVFPADEAWQIAAKLRAGRCFSALRLVCDTFLLCDQSAIQLQRFNAQALIELGQLSTAIVLLEQLATSTEPGSKEHLEACGSLGRAYKQLYVNAGQPANDRSRACLVKALQAYGAVCADKPGEHVWHAINTVALLMRAVRDGVELPDEPDPSGRATGMAEALLAAVQQRQLYKESTMYDCASAAEACWALGRVDEVDGWLRAYLDYPLADQFEVAGTRRQFVEIWQLNPANEADAAVLDRLSSRFITGATGGSLLVSAGEARNSLESRRTPAGNKLEAVLGSEGFQTLNWLEQAKLRAKGVARIGKEAAHGLGTGFLVRGSDLHPAWGDEMLLLTNAHVISSLPEARAAVDAADAVITFEAQGGNETWGVQQELWTSPPAALDTTVLRLDRPAPAMAAYPVASGAPLPDDTQRLYIIGHPAGGALAFSLEDNLLLDCELPKLHYRTPTVGGSSGSPVFNNDWKLVGIHHMGGIYMPRLNGKAGTYPANEGIWLGAIRQAIGLGLGRSTHVNQRDVQT